MNTLFYSLVSTIIALFFLLLGLFALILPWSPAARTDLVLLILEHPGSLAFFGVGLLLIAGSLIIHILLQARHDYFHLRTGPRAVKVDTAILEGYLESYWKQLYPRSVIVQRLMLKRRKMHLIADLPYTPPSEQKELLMKIQEEIEEMLGHFIGYPYPLVLSVRFQEEKKRVAMVELN